MFCQFRSAQLGSLRCETKQSPTTFDGCLPLDILLQNLLQLNNKIFVALFDPFLSFVCLH